MVSKSDLEAGDVVLVTNGGNGLVGEDEGKYVELVEFSDIGYFESSGWRVKAYNCTLETEDPGDNGYIGVESFGNTPMVLLNVHDDEKEEQVKIEVLTAEFNYQGLYKGTVIDNAKVTPNGVEFRHNGKNWVLDKGMYLTFKDRDIQIYTANTTNQPTPITSALDKQVSGDHYKTCGIQPIEYIHANGLNYFQGNVVKYVTRYKDKAGKADLEKAIHYLELMIELEYKEED